ASAACPNWRCFGSDPKTCPACQKRLQTAPLFSHGALGSEYRNGDECVSLLARSAESDAMTRVGTVHEVPAAVVDVGWVNGLAAIRSLGRAGIRVLAVDHRPSALGFRSRYAEPFVSADAHADPTRFVASIRALGEVVVFPTHDGQLNLIAQHLGDLQVHAPFPDWEILERVQSKRAQLEQAELAG